MTKGKIIRCFLPDALHCSFLPAVLLACCLTSPCFAESTNASSPPKAIELRAWDAPLTVSGIENLALTRIITAFRGKFPHIHPVPSTGLEIPGRTFDMTPLMQIAGEIPPHVMYVNFRQSDTYIRNKFLYPLEGYIEQMLGLTVPGGENMPQEQYLAELKKSPKYQELIADRIPEKCWPIMRRECPYGKDCPYAKCNGGDLDFDPAQPHQHVWMFPQGPVIMALFFRKDLFLEAGLPQRTPKDLNELLEWARILTEPSEDRYGIEISLGALGWSTLNILYSMDGRLVEQDEKGQWRCVFDSDQAVNAYYYVARMFHEPFVTRKGNRATSVIYPGESLGGHVKNAMAFEYLDQSFFGKKDLAMYGFGPVPLGPNGRRGSEFNSYMTGIYAGIEDKHLRDAAWEYIRFFDSPKANIIRAKVYAENGLARYIQPKYLRAAGLERQADLVPKEWTDAYDEAIQSGVPEPYGQNCQMIYDYSSKAIDQIRTDPQVKHLIEAHDEHGAKQRIKEILSERVRFSNERMLNLVPPEERKKRNTMASIAAVVIFVLFVLLFRRVFKTFADAQPRTPGQKRGQWQFLRYKWAYLFLIPAIGSILLWSYYPLLRGTIISFQDYNVRGFSTWVGMENFANVLYDSEFWHSMYISLKYTVLFAIFGFTAPIALAVLLSEVPRGKVFYRTMFYLPAVLTGLIMIYLWKGFYGQMGMVNQAINVFIRLMNYLPYVQIQEMHTNWLDNPNLAMFCILLPVVWAGMGPGCLIYLAALKTIPEDIYEAADLDGAGVWSKTFHVALPNIKVLIIINFIGTMVATVKGNGESALAMTGGGPYTPYGQTEFIGLHIYWQAFGFLRFGAATAMAWVLASFLIGFTVMQLQRLSKMEFRTMKGTE